MQNIKRSLALISILFLSLTAIQTAAPEVAAKDVEVVKSSINFKNERPRVAYLIVELKNNKTDKIVSNAVLEVIYYDADEKVIKKSFLKNRLTTSVFPGQTETYRIPLKGRSINERNDEYPYDTSDQVEEFEVRVLSVQYGRG